MLAYDAGSGRVSGYAVRKSEGSERGWEERDKDASSNSEGASLGEPFRLWLIYDQRTPDHCSRAAASRRSPATVPQGRVNGLSPPLPLVSYVVLPWSALISCSYTGYTVRMDFLEATYVPLRRHHPNKTARSLNSPPPTPQIMARSAPRGPALTSSWGAGKILWPTLARI